MTLAMEKCFKAILSILLTLLFCFPSSAQNYPPKPEPAVYVNDLAGIFAEAEKLELENILINYYDSTSTQIVIVTISSLEGMDASQYAIELGEKWGIGQASKDNGVLFLVAPNDRKMFIATGRGTEEKLTDVFLGRIRDGYILPEFKNNNYYQGVKLGVQLMIQRLSGTFVADDEVKAGEISIGILIFILFIMLITFWLISKLSKSVYVGETFSGRGYQGGGFWGGGSNWGGGGWSSGSSGGSFGGGSFGGGGAGGSW